MTRPDDAAWERAVALLAGAREVVLAAHVSPDGDALGCALALGLALEQRGAEVRVSFGDEPFSVPTVLRFLPGQHLLVAPADLPEAPELLVTCDTGSRDRLGLLAPLVDRAAHTLVVDHHATNEGFGSDLLLDTGAPATASVVLELLDRLEAPLDVAIGTCLYTGLVTDTGSFRFAGTTPAVHHTAARLLSLGVPHELVAREVFDTKSAAYLRLLGLALGRLRVEPELLWTSVPAEERRAHGVGLDEIEAVIGTVRSAADRDVAAVFKEDDEGRWIVSTRSRGGADVGRACAELGGGGHRYAAGFTGGSDLDGTVAALRAALSHQPAPGLPAPA